MMPSVALVLNGLARTMLMDLLPQTTHAYAAQTLQLSAALTMMCAQEFDRAAARLVEENRALAQLFADAAPAVTDTALRAELKAAPADAPTLLVSALQEHNRALRALRFEMGDARGRWDGDTLVVETTNFTDKVGVGLSGGGTPNSTAIIRIGVSELLDDLPAAVAARYMVPIAGASFR
jgi:hypothetical protein